MNKFIIEYRYITQGFTVHKPVDVYDFIQGHRTKVTKWIPQESPAKIHNSTDIVYSNPLTNTDLFKSFKRVYEEFTLTKVTEVDEKGKVINTWLPESIDK